MQRSDDKLTVTAEDSRVINTLRETVDSHVQGCSSKNKVKRTSQDNRELRKLAGNRNMGAEAWRWSRKKELLWSRTVMGGIGNWEVVNTQASQNQKPEPALAY